MIDLEAMDCFAFIDYVRPGRLYDSFGDFRLHSRGDGHVIAYTFRFPMLKRDANGTSKISVVDARPSMTRLMATAIASENLMCTAICAPGPPMASASLLEGSYSQQRTLMILFPGALNAGDVRGWLVSLGYTCLTGVRNLGMFQI